jgi:hypothetical protein
MAGDLLIRDAIASGEFFLIDALSREPIDGPFDSFRAAIAAAQVLSPQAVIWRETTDQRGRSLGDPFALPIDHTLDAGANLVSHAAVDCERPNVGLPSPVSQQSSVKEPHGQEQCKN